MRAKKGFIFKPFIYLLPCCQHIKITKSVKLVVSAQVLFFPSLIVVKLALEYRFSKILKVGRRAREDLCPRGENVLVAKEA
jgi:hypothetical protein